MGKLLDQYVDGIPGSVYLVDAAHTATNTAHDERKRDVVLNPAPSKDANDPLNWSRSRKRITGWAALIYTFIVGFGSSTYYPLYDAFEARGLTLAGLTHGVGYQFLLYGLGNLVMLPFAFWAGFRPMMILSQLACAGVNFWTPYISTNGAWYGARCLYGLFGSPVETAAEIIIPQIFFTHERGTWLGIYAFLLFGCSFAAPIMTGFMYEGTSIKFVMWFTAIFNLFGMLIAIFFEEESNYNRKETVEVKLATPTEEKEKGESEVGVVNVAAVDSEGLRVIEGKPYNYIQRLGAFRERYATPRQVFVSCWRPLWLLYKLPLVLWCGLQYGWQLSLYTILINTLSAIIQSPPYNFSASIVGVCYAAPLIGVAIGGMGTGWVSDKLQLYYARKANGVREPETRLLLQAVPLILSTFAMLLWGLAAQYHVHWFALVFAMGTSGFCNGITATLTLAYSLDAYRELSGEVICAVIIARNVLNFALGYATPPWVALGYQNAFIIAAFVGMAFIATFIPIMYYGKALRKSSAATYEKLVETSWFKGHT